MRLISSFKSAAMVSALLVSATGFATAPRFGVLVASDSETNSQEKAAKDYIVNTLGGTVITDASAISVDNFDAIMVHIDRCGIGMGYDNLPADFKNATGALADFVKAGGGVYLSKMATQMATEMGILDPAFQVNIFGDGNGGAGFDDWCINAHLGSWMLNPNNTDPDLDQVYDRRGHAIFAGLLEFDPPTSGDYYHCTFPMEGTGDPTTSMHREDHNCCWDLNAYSAYTVDGKNTLEKWEGTTNSTVLATWGHVQDYCVVGINEFLPTAIYKGKVIANGLAACEWAPREGGNAYHENLEKLTANVMNYIAASSSKVEATVATEGEASYYTMTGIKVQNPENGLFIKVQNGKAVKVAL